MTTLAFVVFQIDAVALVRSLLNRNRPIVHGLSIVLLLPWPTSTGLLRLTFSRLDARHFGLATLIFTNFGHFRNQIKSALGLFSWCFPSCSCRFVCNFELLLCSGLRWWCLIPFFELHAKFVLILKKTFVVSAFFKRFMSTTDVFRFPINWWLTFPLHPFVPCLVGQLQLQAQIASNFESCYLHF